MTLYIKQRVFSWNGSSSVYDAEGNEVFHVKGAGFSFGRDFRLYDAIGNELTHVRQKVLSFLPKYFISRGEDQVAEVVREFTFFKQEYTIDGLGWKVYGDFFAHEYEITDGGVTVASVSKEWFTLGDAYEIRVNDGVDLALAISVVLVVDACIDDANN